MLCQGRATKKMSQAKGDGKIVPFMPDASTVTEKLIEISSSQNEKDLSAEWKGNITPLAGWVVHAL